MSKETKRVTLRDIAADCGYSTMTVSIALRNHPKVRPETRRKILESAERLGYKPDPEVSKLMTHLRHPATHAFSHTLAFVNTWPNPRETESGYIGRMYEGAKQRANAIGFEMEVFQLQEKGMTAKRLSDIFYNRNIRGIFLPPWYGEGEAPDFDWDKFSGVAATLSVSSPRFHRVIPHLFRNTLTAMEELIRLGYQKIGFVDTDDSRHRSNGMLQGAYELKCAEVFKRKAPPALTLHPGGDDELFKWFDRHKPDAILSPQFCHCRRLRERGVRFPEDCGFLVLDSLQSTEATAIDQRPEMLGSAAIDVLTAQIFRNEYGPPPDPRLILIEGRLRPGKTTRNG